MTSESPRCANCNIPMSYIEEFCAAQDKDRNPICEECYSRLSSQRQKDASKSMLNKTNLSLDYISKEELDKTRSMVKGIQFARKKNFREIVKNLMHISGISMSLEDMSRIFTEEVELLAAERK